MIEQALKTLNQAGVTSRIATIICEHRGTTECQVFEVADGPRKLVVKIDVPTHTKNVTAFYQTYAHISLYPKVIYKADDDSFYVYEFIDGEKMGTHIDLHPFLEQIITEVINKYERRDEHVWGEVTKPFASFYDFLIGQVDSRRETTGKELGIDEEHIVKNHITDLFKNFKESPFLTNEDLGVHNIIIKNNRIAGIIDASIAGAIPLYELLFLFCSTPRQLSYESLIPYFHMLKEKSGFTERELPALFKIALYIRIGNCIRHHPEDLSAYKKVYAELKNINFR